MNNLVFYSGTPSEEALLRCTLVYNSIRTKLTRNDIVEKAVYASIALSRIPLTMEQLSDLLYDNYHVRLQSDELRVKIEGLKASNLISHNNYAAIKLANTIDVENTLGNIDKESEMLVVDVYTKAESIFGRPFPNKQIVKQYIREALTFFLRETFLELFELQATKKVEEKDSSIKSTLSGLGDLIGESTIMALSETLNSPTDEQKRIINQWSKAFLTLQIMDLDPKLNEFKRSKLSKKSFVIDTDVALHCLCDNTRFSESYKTLIKELKDMGCPLYIPEEVKREINKHADAAVKWGCSYGDQLLQFTDETLECGIISNAFIEDYVKTVRKQKDAGEPLIPFSVYIENKRDKRNECVLKDNLSDVFGAANVDRKLDYIPEDNDELENLISAILEHTLHTSKADKRSDEENYEIAKADARIYLIVRHMNEDVESDKFFSNKTYILTNSTRTKRCEFEIYGHEKMIICHPNSLYAILGEIGIISDSDDIMSIMDNPYMVYVAEQLWKQIEPILKQNYQVRFQTINKLKSNVNLRLDEVLTAQNANETIQELRKFGDDSLFGRDLLELQKKYDEEKEENKKLRAIIHTQGELLGKKERNKAFYQNNYKMNNQKKRK